MPKSSTTTDATIQSVEPVRLSRAVVDAVAEAEGVDPTDLDPLYGVIDPDCLDALFAPHQRVHGAPDPAAAVTFDYHGYEVRATATGTVELTER